MSSTAPRDRYRAAMYYVNDRSPRYPSKGGFLSYCHKLADGADIRYGMKLEQVDFGKQHSAFRRRQ